MVGAPDDLSDPARNVDLGLITEEANDIRMHTPPPRIAARFYRPANNRRKSSAASSRRNSISSVHSHASSRHGSHVGGAQSNHIAQHLRRASIIEDRKARLADRAAHAEKVRLRAALAKAAPRSTTNREERALAAQQAREKNLAEIVASCAEEVKRAKGIAESMKEKREAETKKMRREMEERLAEAEKRREETLNRGNNGKRGRSLSHPRKSSSPLPVIRERMSESAAALRIQNRWRIHKKWKALKDFADLGLTIDGVRDTSFGEVVDLLNQHKVLLSTGQILKICGLKEGEAGSVSELSAVRTFLSAFVILGHPTQVLSGKGESSEQEQVGVLSMGSNDLANPQLQDLVAKARDLLISFEHVLSRLNSANNYTPPFSQASTISEAYAKFYNAFIAWKSRDSDAIIEMMILQFVELDSIWQTVKGSTEEAVTDSYRAGIRENQLKLIVRIKKLAGPVEGKKLINAALLEARKAKEAKAAKKSRGDSRPRAAASEPPASIPDAEKSVTSHLQTLTPPATPSGSQNSNADLMRTANSILPDNRIVAHELAISKEYRIDIEDCQEQKGQLMQFIFDSMRQEVAAGNSDGWVLAMAENIKTKLQHLLKEGNSMYVLIGEALDQEVIARELANGAFSYEKFFTFMASLLPRLCAPFRDDEVKDLADNKMQNGDIVSRLQALMGFIDLMQLDYANFMLQQSAPEIIKHAGPYETKRFAEALEVSRNDLTHTEAAWRIARTKVLTEAAKRDPENVQLARAQPTPDKIYAQMLVDIFTAIDTSVSIPETLQLDTKRITRTRIDLLRIITVGAILLQVKNLLKRDVRAPWKTEATRLFSVLENSKSAEQATQGIQAALESSRSMPAATKSHIRGLVTRIVTASIEISTASSATTLRDPVMRLLLTRIRGHLLGRLAANTEKEKVRIASMASEALITLGLPEFVARIRGMVEEVGRVGVLDSESHGGWYEVVAGKAEGQPSTPT